MKKQTTAKVWLVLVLCVFANIALTGQSLKHPHIWIKNSDKSAMLEKIEKQKWAGDLYDQYKKRVDAKVNTHKNDPAKILKEIPGLPGDNKKHVEIMTLGFESALLYWLTDDADYGQLAADILSHYTTLISGKNGTIHFSSGKSYSHLIDTRESYTKPPMIYDFVHGYLKKSGTKVYDLSKKKNVAFDFAKAEKAFIKLADGVFNEGSINSNHPILEAPGALLNLLNIENDKKRKEYLDKFMKGTPKQNGLTWMMSECKESTVWPEATGYSIGPHRIILELMNIVDCYDPSMKVIEKNKDVLKNSFLFENYKFPCGKNVMRFGDAHRNNLNTVEILERVRVISRNKGYVALANDATKALQALYKEKSGFKPKVATEMLEWNNPYLLLWGENILTSRATPISYSRSINIDYAGIAMQKNINTSDKAKYGLMGYTGGAHYVHSHLTGIDMELYGLGAVMGSGGGDEGASKRDKDVFRNYHRIYAGHNTVIVNGSSKGKGEGAWKSDNQLFQNTTKTISAEPKSLEEAVSEEFSFSTQELDDKVNNAKQQRVFSVIRTGDKSGYYFDLFRSKSNKTNNYHDYVYHNVGDDVKFVDDANKSLAVSPKSGRYKSQNVNYKGKVIKFPGWHYFEDVKTSAKTNKGVKATIPMTKKGKRYMHMLMPGGENREYTKCFGPYTIEGQFGYAKSKTPIVTVRHYGEAWSKPFVNVFEPSENEKGSVTSIENLYSGTKIVGAKVVSKVDGKTITDYIISNINANDNFKISKPKIEFKGRFAIVRVTDGVVKMYIGDGESLTYGKYALKATNRKGFKVVKTSGNTDDKVEDKDDEKEEEVVVVVESKITSPTVNDVIKVGDTVIIKAKASINVGSIAKVNFKVNNGHLKTVSAAPYEAEWIPSESGSATLNIVVIDDNNKRYISEELVVTVQEDVKEVVVESKITSPTVDDVVKVGEAVIIKANASINVGSIAKVNFRVNNGHLKTVSEAPYEAEWIPSESGPATLDIVVVDENNKRYVSEELVLLVEAEEEEVVFSAELVAPLNNSTYTIGDSILLDAQIVAENVTVEKVNFKVDGKYHAQDKANPYQALWIPEEIGERILSVVAYDTDGNKVISKEVTVTINAAEVEDTKEDEEVINDSDYSGVYKFRNLAYDLYLDAKGEGAAVGANRESLDRHWKLAKLESGAYNIDCEYKNIGCLDSEAHGIIVASDVDSPNTAIDKQWDVISLGNNIYRFKNKAKGRGYLSANDSTKWIGWSFREDDYTKWELISVSQLKSSIASSNDITDEVKATVYPNPAKAKFVISIQGVEEGVVSIYNISGALVYKTKYVGSDIHMYKNDVFKSGIYIIKVISKTGERAVSKLIIK